MKILPYQNDKSSKKRQVIKMFNKIAKHYDSLNHILSFGIDKIWRRKVVKEIRSYKPKRILDIATGTGDLAFSCLSLKPNKVIGIDITKNMLEIAEKKAIKKQKKNKVEFALANALNLSFPDNYFQAITCGFGVRNFEDYQLGLQNMYRVLDYGGICAILELSQPTHFPFRQFYHIYNYYIVYRIGKMISKSQEAYIYLPKSIDSFPKSEVFLDYLKDAGFKNTRALSLSFGICHLYLGEKN